jgi:hypothetical protein
MAEDDQTRLNALIEARNKVKRQMEIMVGGRPPFAFDRDIQIKDVMAELNRTLSELEECIALLESKNIEN